MNPENHIDEKGVCYYCGARGSDTDHVIPQIMLGIETYNVIHQNRILTVSCCHECNSLLSSSVQKTLEKRKKILKTRLRRKYRKLLSTPEWTITELNAMGPNLRPHIEESLLAKKYILARLRW